MKQVKDVRVDLIEFDDFFDTLFMKFKITYPPKDTLEQLRVLLCVQFGPNVKEPSYFLVKKIERVLYDLDYVYVNLVKILREPDHEKLQAQAMLQLKQRYEFVARGITKTAQPVAKQTSAEAAYHETSASKSQKPRPMSSKPVKKLEKHSIEKKRTSTNQSADEEIAEVADDIDDDIDEYEQDTRNKFDR